MAKVVKGISKGYQRDVVITVKIKISVKYKV